MSTNYTAEEKKSVLEMLAQNMGVSKIVSETGIPRSTVYLWKKSIDNPIGKSKVQSNPVQLDCTVDVQELYNNVQRLLDVQSNPIGPADFENRVAELERWQRATVAAFKFILEDKLKYLENKDTEGLGGYSLVAHDKSVARARMLLDAFDPKPEQI